MAEQLRGPFEKFVDSPYSKKRSSPHLYEVPTWSNKSSPYYSEICGGTVTVSSLNKVRPRTLHTALVHEINLLTSRANKERFSSLEVG
jgi:hypothetical protein